jgi:hypothetical protein
MGTAWIGLGLLAVLRCNLDGRSNLVGTFVRFTAYSRATRRGGVVPTPDEYAQRAAECIRLAQATTHQGNKLLLLEMAQAWLKLAARPQPESPKILDNEDC